MERYLCIATKEIGMITTYVCVSSIILTLLFVVWRTNSNLNLFIKILLLFLAIFGVFCSLLSLGYVFRL